MIPLQMLMGDESVDTRAEMITMIAEAKPAQERRDRCHHDTRVKRSELRQRDDYNNDGGRRPSKWLSHAPSRATAQVVARGIFVER